MMKAIPNQHLLRERLHDPVVSQWILRKLKERRDCQAPDYEELEEFFFNDVSLARLIEADDPDVLPQIFHLVRKERFHAVSELMVRRWPQWKAATAGGAAPIIALNCPDRALSVFDAYLKDPGDSYDIDKVHGIAKSLCLIAPERGRELSGVIVSSVTESPQDFVRDTLFEEAFFLAWTHELPAWREILLPVLEAGDPRKLDRICSRLSKVGGLRGLIRARVEGYAEQSFESISWMFRPGAPLKEIDELLDDPDSEFGRRVVPLLQKYGAESSGSTVARISDLVRTRDPRREDVPSATGQMFLALLAETFVIDRPDASVLDIHEFLRRLALELYPHPFQGELCDRIASFPRDQVVDALRGYLPEHVDSNAELHLVRMMQRLAWPEFVPLLIDLVGEDGGDSVCEDAARALERIGEPAEREILERWKDLDPSQRIYLGDVLGEIGGAETVDHLVRLFPTMRGRDLELWCDWAESIPDVRLLELLDPELKRHHPAVENAFLTIATVLGVDHPQLAAVRERSEKQRREFQQRRSEGILAPLATGKPTLRMELECPECGDVNCYDVKELFIDPDHRTKDPYIADEFACVSCGRFTDLKIGSRADLALIAETVKIVAAKRSNSPYESPLKFVGMTIEGGRRVTPGEAIGYYRSLVEKNPNSVEAHLGLGNCYYHVNRKRQAAECFRHCLVLDEACPEAALSLGRCLRDQGQREAAYRILRDAYRRRAQWTFHRLRGASPLDLELDVVELIENLRPEIAPDDPPFLAPRASVSRTKVGRNDPCPCGSGKKYKKCCGG